MFIPYAPDSWLNLAWVTKIHDVWSTEAAQAELVLWVAGEAEPYRLQGEDRTALLAWLQAQDATRRGRDAA
jgi:hypothetical protein